MASNSSDFPSAHETLTGNFFGDVTALYAVSFGGPILFWLPASTELLAAAVGRRGFPPALVGITCAAGQCSLFVLLYLFGERIASRWHWLRRRVDAVRNSSQRKLMDRGSFAMTLGAAAFGVPPTVPLFTLAPSFHMRLMPMILIHFALRFLRFASFCLLGSAHRGGSGSVSLSMLYSSIYEMRTPQEMRTAPPHVHIGAAPLAGALDFANATAVSAYG